MSKPKSASVDFDEVAACSGSDVVRAVTDPMILSSIEHIHALYPQRITVAQLAGRANLSREHFLRRFEAALGEPPAAYIRRLRLNTAATWLSISDRSLAEIVAMTGYGSQSALTRAFARRFGQTPVAFRRRTRSEESQWLSDYRGPQPSFRLIEFPPMQVAAMRFLGDNDSLEQHWQEFTRQLVAAGLPSERLPAIGLRYEDLRYTPASEVSYDCTVPVETGMIERIRAPLYLTQLTGGFGVLVAHRGTQPVMQEKLRLVTHWIQQSKYRFFPRPSYEIYYAAPWLSEEHDMATHIALEIRE